jgi:hypothetical protein
MKISKALWKRINQYSPWQSDDKEKWKLEDLGIHFSKCGSCGQKYPDQRINEFCDQCEGEASDNRLEPDMTVNEQELTRHIETLQNKVEELEAEVKRLKKKKKK